MNFAQMVKQVAEQSKAHRIVGGSAETPVVAAEGVKKPPSELRLIYVARSFIRDGRPLHFANRPAFVVSFPAGLATGGTGRTIPFTGGPSMAGLE